jgi:hypothetical protein
VHGRSRVAFGEAHDVVKVSSPPGIDTLSIVADRHDLVVHTEDIDNLRLQAIGILKLVD